MFRTISLFMGGWLLFSCTSPKNTKEMNEIQNPLYLLVGSYAEPETDGIYVYTFNEANGETTSVSSLKGISNPSYLTISKNGNRIYAVAEDDNEQAAANALSFDKETGQLTFLNAQPTHGESPCYINMDPEERFIVTANYTGGNMSVFPLDKEGKLISASQVINFTGSGIDPERQQQPHLHCAVFSPDGNYLFAEDLGTDAIHKFKIDYNTERGEFLVPGEPAFYSVEPGSGPRHVCFHPNERFAYLINELSGQVTTFSYDNGNLTAIQYIESDTVGARGSADIHITQDGKYLYSSNRLKADGLAIFKVNNETGLLTKIGYQETGIHPRNFIISPDGNYLLVATRDSNLVQVFLINKETGLLTDTGKNIQVSKPVCLKFIR